MNAEHVKSIRAFPVKKHNASERVHGRRLLRFESNEELDNVSIKSNDSDGTDLTYNYVSDNEEGVKKLVITTYKYCYPPFFVGMRCLTATNLARVLVPQSQTSNKKIKQLVSNKNIKQHEYPLLVMLQNAFRDDVSKAASKKDIGFVEIICENGELHDVVYGSNFDNEHSLKKLSHNQDRFYQCYMDALVEISGKVTRPFMTLQGIHKVGRCLLVDELARRWNGVSVRKTRGFTMPEQWVFPTRRLALAFYIIAPCIAHGNKKFFKDLKKAAKTKHNQSKIYEQLQRRQMTSRKKENEENAKEREELSSDEQVTAFTCLMWGDKKVTKAIGNIMPYMYAITSFKNPDLFYLAFPDMKTVEYFLKINRPPKKSNPNYQQAITYIDVNELMKIDPNNLAVPVTSNIKVRNTNLVNKKHVGATEEASCNDLQDKNETADDVEPEEANRKRKRNEPQVEDDTDSDSENLNESADEKKTDPDYAMEEDSDSDIYN